MALDDLIARTTAQAGGDDPLSRLAAASEIQQELAEEGEQLLDHFVTEARESGSSWAQIGAALGVSKQAAQQRHGRWPKFFNPVTLLRGREGRSRMFQRFTDRARSVVVTAQEEARRLGHNYIGTEHLLLGLIRVDGVARAALDELGVTLKAARADIEEIIGRGEDQPSGHIPFTPRSKKVLELALREAIHLGHNYIGTEHILLGLIREGEGVGLQVLVRRGVTGTQVTEKVLETLRNDS